MARFRFGDFTLDMSHFELTRGGHKVAVQPKIIDLLHVLLSAPGRVVTRSELFERVWPGVRVGQASLNRAVRELRRVLGDDGPSRYVATVNRRGYRFIAHVESESDALQPHRATPASPASTIIAPSERGRHVQNALFLASCAQTLDELGSAFEIPRAILGSAGTVVCRYTDSGADLSGSHRDFVARHRKEYSSDDVFQRRAARLDYDAGPHIAIHMSRDELREHRQSIAYNEFYRPVGVNDAICVPLTPGRTCAPGSLVLVLGREQPYEDEELWSLRWLQEVFAAAVARLRRRANDERMLSSSLFEPSGQARCSAWDMNGQLLWHSPRGTELLGAPRRLPAALQAALSAWVAAARGLISGAPPPSSVMFTNERRKPIRARLRLGPLPSGDPMVLIDFEAASSHRLRP